MLIVDWAVTIPAVASAVASVGAVVVALIALRPARQAAQEAEQQNELQRQAFAESHQPTLWVDIQPSSARGRILNIVLANEGPTVATTVRVRFSPEIPLTDGPFDRSDVAQSRLREGIKTLVPGRRLIWPIGLASARLEEADSFDSTVTYRATIEADGPEGPLSATELEIRPADWRETSDEPPGSLHTVAKQIAELGRVLKRA